MTKVHDSLEVGFANLARLVYRHPFIAILISLLLMGSLASNLPKIKVDTSTEGFLHEGDPTLIDYNNFRERYGRDEVIIIAVRSGKDETVFKKEFLSHLKELHTRLENNVPHLDEVISMVNARNTYADGDTLIVEDLLENFPETDDDLNRLSKRVLSNPLYRDNMISRDGHVTSLIIRTNAFSSEGVEESDELEGFGDEDEFETDAVNEPTIPRKFLSTQENAEVVTAVMAAVNEFENEKFKMSVAGSPFFMDTLKGAMLYNIPRFMVGIIVVIAILLFIMFRRLSGVAIPLIIVLTSLLSTVGLMAALGIAIKLPTMILPSFVLAVGVGDAVHILAIFYHRLHKGDSKEEAIVYSMGHSGLAVLLTSLTTAAGLLSFAWAEIAPVVDLGLFACAGVMFAFIYTVILLPALVSILPIKDKREDKNKSHHKKMDDLLGAITEISTGYPKAIATICAVITLVALMGASKIVFSHNPLAWLPDSARVKGDTKFIDHAMKGSVVLELILDTKKENGAQDPIFLAKVEAFQKELTNYSNDGVAVGKTMALADIIKEIHKALNEGKEEFYKVPSDQKLAAQEFILFENSGSDDLEDFTDSLFSQTRFTIKVPWMDAIKYTPFINDITKRAKDTFGADVKITVTGMLPLLGRTLRAAIFSAAKSYVIAICVISVMMIFLIGRVRLGLISMIPNLFPIVITLGVIGWFNLPMDMFTMLFASISIGLAVDDTVHFMNGFRRYHDLLGNAKEAVRKTLGSTGRAMLTTTIVLSAGFFILCFSTLNNLFYFGLLTGFTIAMALISDFFLAPALMMFVAKDKKEPV